VNYYHLDSTLSGHSDHSERDLSHPLLSIRYGSSGNAFCGSKQRWCIFCRLGLYFDWFKLERGILFYSPFLLTL